jgi:hypothetical protein
MAQIIIPLAEAIQVFRANVPLEGVVKRVDPSEYGPRLAIRLSPVLRESYITIRFVQFENNTAQFYLDGVSPMINLNAMLKLPQGISISGNRLFVRTDVLLQTLLGLRGLAVRSVVWAGGAYHIETAAA